MTRKKKKTEQATVYDRQHLFVEADAICTDATTTETVCTAWIVPGLLRHLRARRIVIGCITAGTLVAGGILRAWWPAWVTVLAVLWVQSRSLMRPVYEADEVAQDARDLRTSCRQFSDKQLRRPSTDARVASRVLEYFWRRLDAIRTRASALAGPLNLAPWSIYRKELDRLAAAGVERTDATFVLVKAYGFKHEWIQAVYSWGPRQKVLNVQGRYESEYHLRCLVKSITDDTGTIVLGPLKGWKVNVLCYGPEYIED
jgi:hypothetical protein